MNEHIYTEDDLRHEAARQHAEAADDLDFMGIGERMQGSEIKSMLPPWEADGAEGMHWEHLAPHEFEAAQRSVDTLLTEAADISRWAIDLGQAGLLPMSDMLELRGEGGSLMRVHIAARPDLPDAVRRKLLLGFAQVIADHNAETGNT